MNMKATQGSDDGFLTRVHKAQDEIKHEYGEHGAAFAYHKLVEEVNDFRKLNPTNDQLTKSFALKLEQTSEFNSSLPDQMQLQWLSENFQQIAGKGETEISKKSLAEFTKTTKDPLNAAMAQGFAGYFGEGDRKFNSIDFRSGDQDTIDKTDIVLRQSFYNSGTMMGDQLLEWMKFESKSIFDEHPELCRSHTGFLNKDDLDAALKSRTLPQFQLRDLQFMRDNYYTISRININVAQWPFNRGIEKSDLQAYQKVDGARIDYK